MGKAYRVLNSICRVLSNVMRNDLLLNTVRSSGVSEELRVASVVETGEEEGRLIDGAAYRQKTIVFSQVRNMRGNISNRCYIYTHP